MASRRDCGPCGVPEEPSGKVSPGSVLVSGVAITQTAEQHLRGPGGENWAVQPVSGGQDEADSPFPAGVPQHLGALVEIDGAVSREEAVLVVVEVTVEVAMVTREDVEQGQEQNKMEKEEPKEHPEQEQGQCLENAQKQEEKMPAETESGKTTIQPPLEELQALQLDLGPVNSHATRAYGRLKQKLRKRRKPLLDCRSHIIQTIPGFWVQTFVNHPEMSAMITDQDEDMLSYMINLEIEELQHPTNCWKIMLSFGNNPYFRNKVIVKEYLMEIAGYRACHSTPIQWYQDYKCEAYSRRHNDSSPNFFNWFIDHNFAGSNRIVEIIRKDLWLNPLYYYRRMKAPKEGAERTDEQDMNTQQNLMHRK